MEMSNNIKTYQPDSVSNSFGDFRDMNVAMLPDQNKALENIRYSIRFCGEVFLTPLGVNEVVNVSEVYPIPNVPNWIQGVINIRGNLVPVFDLSLLYACSKPANYRLVVLNQHEEEKAVALVIDDYPIAVNLDSEEVVEVEDKQVRSRIVEDYVIKIYSIDNQLCFEIDYDEFFSDICRDYV